MLKGFRDFILRGNVVDLAVAVVIGAAFGDIVKSLVGDVITPLIAAIVKKPDFSYLILHVHGGAIKYGSFLNAAISFLLIAATVYFLVVLPLNALLARLKINKAAAAAAPATKPCPECLSDIPLAAKRCSHCGQPVPVIA
jgi:large conductance mechanosensitive channel